MFKRTEALRSAEHADLKVLESNDYSYARHVLIAPIMLSETADIAREYPIVFPTTDTRLPCALMGLEPEKNAYVAADGQWQARYIPAHIRRYPFILSQMQNDDAGKQRFAIIFDPDAPQLNNANGHPVFTAEGELSDHMKSRLKLLEHMQRSIPVTQRIFDAVDNAGLLVERTIRLSRDGKATHEIKGIRVIDEKKLNDLPHDKFAALRDQGALPLVYAQLLSWANFRHGPLAGMYPDLTQQSSTGTPEFLFEDNDTLDFSKLFHDS